MPKVLHPLCGRPMLAYVLDAWDEAAAASGGSPRPVVVYSPAVEAIRPAFADRAERDHHAHTRQRRDLGLEIHATAIQLFP